MNTNEIQKALQPVEHEGRILHDARKLHAWLGVDSRFHVWIKRRVEEYGFEEETDFRPNLVKTGGRPRQDYLLTRDMAKELAMVERTAVGRMTRNYFNMWMRRRINEYGFEEPLDFCCERSKTGGRPRTDYLLTCDTAKELAMVERTAVGD